MSGYVSIGYGDLVFAAILLIGGDTGLGVLLAVFGAIRLLTDDRDRLRLDRLNTG